MENHTLGNSAPDTTTTANVAPSVEAHVDAFTSASATSDAPLMGFDFGTILRGHMRIKTKQDRESTDATIVFSESPTYCTPSCEPPKNETAQPKLVLSVRDAEQAASIGAAFIRLAYNMHMRQQATLNNLGFEL